MLDVAKKSGYEIGLAVSLKISSLRPWLHHIECFTGEKRGIKLSDIFLDLTPIKNENSYTV